MDKMSQTVHTILDNFLAGEYFSTNNIIIYFLCFTVFSAFICFILSKNEKPSEYADMSFWFYVLAIIVVDIFGSIALLVLYLIISLILIYCWYVFLIVGTILLSALLYKLLLTSYFSWKQ